MRWSVIQKPILTPMDDLSQKQLEKTATAYEELLVPALFQEWADRLA